MGEEGRGSGEKEERPREPRMRKRSEWLKEANKGGGRRGAEGRGGREKLMTHSSDDLANKAVPKELLDPLRVPGLHGSHERRRELLVAVVGLRRRPLPSSAAASALPFPVLCV